MVLKPSDSTVQPERIDSIPKYEIESDSIGRAVAYGRDPYFSVRLAFLLHAILAEMQMGAPARLLQP